MYSNSKRPYRRYISLAYLGPYFPDYWYYANRHERTTVIDDYWAVETSYDCLRLAGGFGYSYLTCLRFSSRWWSVTINVSLAINGAKPIWSAAIERYYCPNKCCYREWKVGHKNLSSQGKVLKVYQGCYRIRCYYKENCRYKDVENWSLSWSSIERNCCYTNLACFNWIIECLVPLDLYQNRYQIKYSFGDGVLKVARLLSTTRWDAKDYVLTLLRCAYRSRALRRLRL